MTLVELAVKYRAIIEKAMQKLDDETASEAPPLHPKWEVGVEQVTGERVLYNSVLYKILTTHVAQEDWAPDVSPSLFAEVLIPNEDEIPEWKQPDSTNPYMSGDKVSHNGSIWVSIVDNNVWEPGAYGWVIA